LLLGQAWPLMSRAETASPSTQVVTSPTGQVPGDEISFFTGKTRLWKGRSQIICFQVAQPASEDRYFSFQLDEKRLHLLIPPRILKGEKIGYLRLQALAEGTTRIAIEGAKLDVEIVKDPAMNSIAELNPEIVTPASGADVWGEFMVGVEQLSLGDPSQLSVPTLLLPHGKELSGQVVPAQKPGPHMRWVFTVKAGDLSRGSNKLVAVEKDEAGREVQSDPIYIDVIEPEPGAILSGPCAGENSGDRASGDGSDAPKVINEDKHGQGMIVDDGDEGHSWCLPVWIAKNGEYQMMVTARGEFAGDALPTLALRVDEEPQPQTTVRLATTDWQRIPVGHPVALTEGWHILSARIRNGFAQGPEDTRSLYLQKYEFAAVSGPQTNLAANAGGGSPMMAMAAANDAGAGAGGSPMMAMVAANNMDPTLPMMAGNPSDGEAGQGLHITFANNIDGQIVTGAIDVAAQIWWPDREHSPPPRTELYVNRKLVATQIAARPRFTIDPAAFGPGANTLELRAVLPSGAWAKSVPFTVVVPPDFPLPQVAFRPTVYFTTYNSGLNRSIQPPQKQGDPELATFSTNGESTVILPANLSGKFRVVIEARGDSYQGPPVMKVALKNGGIETKLGEIPVAPKMGTVQAGSVDLAPGEKELTIAFTNDLYDQGKGDRNLFVRAVRLVPVDETPDRTPPRVIIAYAPRESRAGSVDAVVASVMDSRRVAWTDLLIDDQPQQLDETPRYGLGPVVLPLLTRDLKPGLHRLKVIAHDDAGNQGSSSETLFTVTSAATTIGKYRRALFLLNRFGYGPEPNEIAAILTMGEQKWLESRLGQGIQSPAEENEREALRAQFSNERDASQVTSGAVEYLLAAPNPVRARLLMWTENHFSTWITKDGPSAKAREHESFLKLGPAPFFDLLFNSATSPAMLVYLDQRSSFSHRLNENYAREIMELHTLGVNGGYTQKDVTTLADLLTGWTLDDEAPLNGDGGELDRYFGYDPQLNSGTACRIFGVEFPGVESEQRFDRVLMALEVLSGHPSCATFVSRKLCEQYVSDPPPPRIVHDIAQVYLETGGDISAMLVAMAEHPDFWASPEKVASPIDFGVRAARMARSTNPGPVSTLLSSSGMGMFDRATPDGYPEDDGYSVNTNAMLQRWRFAQSIQNDFVGAGLIPNSWRPVDTDWNDGTTQHIVDLAAVRMTGNVLSEASNDAAQKLLAAAPPNTDARLHVLAAFICQLPESSLK
jgi:hypothetical protein